MRPRPTQAATNSATNSSTNLVTALQNLAPSLTTNSGTTDQRSVGAGLTGSRAIRGHISRAAGTPERWFDSAAGTLLPIQGTYYATMFASMPAKMLISLGNSMGASQAMQAGQQAMLADVQSLVDGKLKALLGSISGQMRGFGSQITAQLASAGKLGGLSVPNGWAQNAPEMVRAAPDVAGQQHRRADCVCGNAHQPVHPSADGFAQRTRHGHAGRQDGVRES